MCISFQVVVSFVYWTSTVYGVRTRCIGQWSHCISEMPKQSFLYSNPYLWLVRWKYTKSKFRIEWYLYSGNSWLSYRYLVCNSNLWSMAICTNCLAFWGGEWRCMMMMSDDGWWWWMMMMMDDDEWWWVLVKSVKWWGLMRNEMGDVGWDVWCGSKCYNQGLNEVLVMGGYRMRGVLSLKEGIA